MALKFPKASDETARAAQKAAIEWVKKFWPAVLRKLEGSEDERILLDLGKLMLAYAYGKPREMVEHTGDVTHTYVVEAPPGMETGEWQKAYAVTNQETLH